MAVVVNTLMVGLSDNTKTLIEKYCEHVVTNVKVGLDAGTVDSEHIVALNEEVNYVPVLISDKIENIAQEGMTPIKAPYFSCIVVSGFVRDNETGLYSIRFSLDPATASEIETCLSVADIPPDDVTVWMVIPVFQCRNTEILEQVSACMMGVLADISFQISINDFKIKRAKMTTNKKLIPINGNEYEISYIYLQNLGIWCTTSEVGFMVNNINHATLSDCHSECCYGPNGELSLVQKLEKTRGNSSFVLQPSMTMMGNHPARYDLGYKTRKGNEKVVTDSLPLNAQFSWLSRELLSRTVRDNGDIAFNVVPVTKAPDLTSMDTTRVTKKKTKVVPKELVKATPDIVLDETEDDFTITKFHDEYPDRTGNLQLRDLTAKNKETITNAGPKKAIRFPADLTEIISPGKSRMASTAIKDITTRRLNVSRISPRTIQLPEENDEEDGSPTPPPESNDTPAAPANRNGNNRTVSFNPENVDGAGSERSELTSGNGQDNREPDLTPPQPNAVESVNRLIESMNEFTDRELTFLDERNRSRIRMVNQILNKTREELIQGTEDAEELEPEAPAANSSTMTEYVEATDNDAEVAEDRLVNSNLDLIDDN